MDKKGQNTVTDKELLAICNLSNLKMEFADLALARDKETGEIARNHTISSLLDNEIAGMKKRKEKKREYDNQIYSRLKELSKEVTSDNVREVQEQLNKEYLSEIGKDVIIKKDINYEKNKKNDIFTNNINIFVSD